MATFEAVDFIPLDGRNLPETIATLRQFFDDESNRDVLTIMSELRHG